MRWEPDDDMRPLGAAVCTGGHLIHSDVGAWNQDQLPNFCSQCGAQVIVGCPSCQYPLQGADAADLQWHRERFCSNCGSPFPWTPRAARVDQLRRYVAVAQLSDAERASVLAEIEILVGPTPKANRAAKAYEAIQSKAPAIWAQVGPIVASLLSAEARRAAGLPPG